MSIRSSVEFLLLAVLLLIAMLLDPFVAIQSQENYGPLHDKGKKAGGKLVLPFEPDHSVIYPNVEELAKRSDFIVVGRTLAHRARLSADRSFITEDFVVHIQEAIKGDMKAGGPIVVSLPGGTFRFSDGVYVYLYPKDYKEAADGRTYVFFLRNKGTNYKGHELSGGVQALFDITGGKVQPADLVAGDPMAARYKDYSAAAFLAQIHNAVGRRGPKH